MECARVTAIRGDQPRRLTLGPNLPKLLGIRDDTQGSSFLVSVTPGDYTRHLYVITK